MLKKVVWLWAVILFLPVSLANAAEEQWVAGQHYDVLPYPVRTRDSSKIEVVELFWYGCPHCDKLNPLISAWEKKLPDDVDFWFSPAIFGKSWKIHAQAFYAAEALGVQGKLHDKFFDALHRERLKLNTEDQLASFFVRNGVKEEDFRKAFNSFSVKKSKLDQAESRGKSYRATGVPALIVNGKYRIAATKAG